MNTMAFLSSISQTLMTAWWNKVQSRTSLMKLATTDPLQVLSMLHAEVKKPLSGIEGICFGCNSHIAEVLKASRDYLWNHLPFFFGLETK